MYFYNLIKDMAEKEKVLIFVDMDGVIAAFDFGKPLEFDKKRPLHSNIDTLEKISKLDNVELQILSACRTEDQIREKNEWLDKCAPFFTKRNILARELHGNVLSSTMKANFLSELKEDRKIVLLDDDIAVLREVKNRLNHIICMQDSELID